MKKAFLFTTLLLSIASLLWAQVPQSFKYQAVLRDNQGVEITNEQVSVRINLLAGSETGETVYSEEHTLTTSAQGLINLNIGDGTASIGDFAQMDWTTGKMFIEIAINRKQQGFEVMGTSQLLAVPYALHAETVTKVNDADADPENEIQDLKLVGTQLSLTKSSSSVNLANASPWQVKDGHVVLPEGANVGIGTIKPQGKLEVRGNIKDTPDDILFSVLNNSGDTVFAVYQGGVRINVDDASTTKTARGGFAVASRGAAKAEAVDIFNVTSDSVLIYLNEPAGKAARGGFAVASRGAAKGGTENVLSVSKSNTNIYVSDPKSGFAITNTSKGVEQQLFKLTEQNYFIGHEVAPTITTGTKNSVFGYLAGNSLNLGSNNVFIGNEAGKSITSGHENIFIGNYSGHKSIGPTRNLFIGDSAGRDNVSGQYNVYLGSSAGKKGTGFYNVVLGGLAASDNDFGHANTIIGYGAGRLSTSEKNIYLGVSAGYANTGQVGGNVFIGYYAGDYGSLNSSDNRLAICGTDRAVAPLVYGEFDNKLLKANGDFVATGNIGLNTTSFGNGTQTLALKVGVTPTTSSVGGVLLYAAANGTPAELRVRDEEGNITTLSPHNFSLTPKSESMAWSYYSENQELGYKINVDMLKTVRLIEQISGEKLVYLSTLDNSPIDSKLHTENDSQTVIQSQNQLIESQKTEIESIKSEMEILKKEMETLKLLLNNLSK